MSTFTFSHNGKSVSINVREIYSAQKYYGVTLLKMISGEFYESSTLDINALITQDDWKFHGMAEFSETMVFFGRDSYGYDEIVRAEYVSTYLSDGGIDVLIFGGFTKTYYVHNAGEVLMRIEKNRLRIVQDNEKLFQVSGSEKTIFVHSMIPKNDIVNTIVINRRDMPVMNIIHKSGAQTQMFGWLV